MSQQINLLKQRHEPIGSALLALGALVLMLVGLLGYGGGLLAEASRLQKTANVSTQGLAQVKQGLQDLRQRLAAENDRPALKAEIEELKPKAEAFKQLVDQVRSGGLGSAEGYANHLNALARVSEAGLWLTQVKVSNSGKVVHISGRALRNEAVMRYAKRLNESFAGFGVQFNSLEMTPENVAKAGDVGKPVLTTVAFKLF